jgi:1-acyl-sn-glycerol-3-phosphate acyltransferase
VFYWVMKRIFMGPLLKLLFRPWIKGLDNVPAEGPAVLASNHLSFSDSIFMPLMVPRPVVFLAKLEYFTGKGLKGKLTAAFFRLTNQLPMDRSGGAASANSLDSGMQILKDGGLLGIYPEGTRSPDGKLYRGKVGVAKLVLTTGVPVIPVAMIGTDKVQPIGRRIPNIRRIGVIFGEPMDFSRYQGLENDRFVQRSVTDEIMYELMRLSGQEYVDMYASTVKERLAAKKTGKAGTDAKNAAVRLDPELDKVVKPGTVSVIGQQPSRNGTHPDTPIPDQPAAEDPAVDTPVADRAPADGPTADKPSAGKSAPKGPAEDKPSADKSAPKGPAEDKPSAGIPILDKPSADRPTDAGTFTSGAPKPSHSQAEPGPPAAAD